MYIIISHKITQYHTKLLNTNYTTYMFRMLKNILYNIEYDVELKYNVLAEEKKI